MLNQNVFIRLLRVIGGVSIILILTHRLELLFSGIYYQISLYVCVLFSLLFTFFLMYVTFFRIKHMYKVLKSDKLNIYNSPFDAFGSFIARLVLCSKGFCEVSAPIGIAFGALAGLDELRKLKGYEPVFLPFLADALLPDSESAKLMREHRLKTSHLFQNQTELDFNKAELGIVEKLKANNFITQEEYTNWKSSIEQNNLLINKNNNEIKSSLVSTLEKLNEIRNNRNK